MESVFDFSIPRASPDINGLEDGPIGVSSQRETQFRLVLEQVLPSKKNSGEYSWKLANFVRHAKLLITKVSAREWPSGP
jgi:hypothetical protein